MKSRLLPAGEAVGACSVALSNRAALALAITGAIVVPVHSTGAFPKPAAVPSARTTFAGPLDGDLRQPSTGYTSAQIVARVNAQRAANDIPGGVGLDASWSSGCHQLDEYEHLHGDNFAHSETPGSAGYSSLGNTIALSGPVLDIDGGSSVTGWAPDPFEPGPSHLFALLDPRLSVMGADDSVFDEGSGLVEEICATTTIGYDRPAPAKYSIYTYPGDGATIYPSETADELPAPPGASVGIPTGTTTGPYILVYADGPFAPSSVKVTRATLDGPHGAVRVGVVTRPGGGGGFVIPVSPLDDHTKYVASVALSVMGAVVRHDWAFTTNSADDQAAGASGPGTTTVTGPVPVTGTVPPPPPPAQGFNLTEAWSVSLPDAGSPIALSSPNVATLAGAPAVVVGDRSGHIYAFSLARGSPVPGWPVSTDGTPVDSAPSVAVLKATAPNDTVFVGVGSAATPYKGGYDAFNPNGSKLWSKTASNRLGRSGPAEAVEASLAVGDLQGGTDVVAPSLGQQEYALNASTGATLPGFPWYTSAADFSTPALADLYGNGKTEIIEGGNQSPGLSYGVTYTKGGHLRVIAPTGNAGLASPAGGLDCQYNTNQVVQSSPAVGPILRGGAVGIAVGTGTYWSGASQTDEVLAFRNNCKLVWATRLDGATTSSPALADLMGSGHLDVVEGTDNGAGGGSVYALSGLSGAVLWHRAMPAEVVGSVVTADLGTGYQDVIVPTTRGAEVLDGRTGDVQAVLAPNEGLQDSPLVTDDPNGTIGITLAGYNGHDQGAIEHYELVGSNGAKVDEVGAWPMFHHDPQLSGNAGAP